jgi:hypothetical protein
MNRPRPDVHTERQAFVTMVWKQQQDTSSLENGEVGDYVQNRTNCDSKSLL